MSINLDSTRLAQRADSVDSVKKNGPQGSTSGSTDFASRASGLMKGKKMEPEEVMREKPKVWVSTGSASA